MSHNQKLKTGRRISLPAPNAEHKITNNDYQRNRKWSSVDPPDGTIKYTASYTDTLPCIAAQHETTTSEIMTINRLMSSMIFPGQKLKEQKTLRVLYLPDKNYERIRNAACSKCDTAEEASFDVKHESEIETLLDCNVIDITNEPVKGRIQITDDEITFEPVTECEDDIHPKLIIPITTIRKTAIMAASQHIVGPRMDTNSRHRRFSRSTTAQEVSLESCRLKATSRLTDKNGTLLILQCNPPVTRRHTLTFLTKAAKNLAKEYCFEIPCERAHDFQVLLKKWISNSEVSSEISESERERSVFTLHVLLKEGCDLLHTNSSGSEDTYVKFKVDKTVVHKSRAVHKSRNPKWLEPLQLNIQSLSIPIKLIVMSCEPGHMDKKIGETAIVPQELSVNIPTELKLDIVDKKNETLNGRLGYLVVQCTLTDLLCQNVIDGDDTDDKLPSMSEDSYILEESHIMKLQNHLPSTTEDRKWMLAYSSQKHGYSINTMYRRMSGVDSATLLVIQNTDNEVFGALLSCPPKISDCFYGTGDSFLYTFSPSFKKFGWSGKNFHIIKGDECGLAIGAGEGLYGIWFDSELYHGHTEHCETFDNEPLTSANDFIVRNIEIWYFLGCD